MPWKLVALVTALSALTDYALASPQPVHAQSEVTARRFQKPIVIDGLLEETCWPDAGRVSNFTEYSPREGAKPEVETEVLLGYDATYLYIGFLCYENDCSKIRSTRAERDALLDIQNDDLIMIALDLYDTSYKGFILYLNPQGVQADDFSDERAEIYDLAVDLEWKAKSRILDDRWTAEIAVPFKSLRFPSAARQHWRVDFIRARPRLSEQQYSWVPRSRDGLLFAKLGHLYIDERLSVTGGSDLLPYLVVGSRSDRLAEASLTARMGLTGKQRIAPDVVLDWAIRPDYSQIESDEPQIDVNTTFALYYPEKRPLFLERKELFETPIQAVYTRTINDPLAILKLSGRLKNTELGYIAALDQHTPWLIPFAEQGCHVSSNRRSLSNILRIVLEPLTQSRIGLMTTTRELENSFNRVLGMDGTLGLPKNCYFTLQGLGSWTKEPSDSSLFGGYPWLTFGNRTSKFDGEEFLGTALNTQLSRKGGKYIDFDLWLRNCSPEFRAENGFIESNDFKKQGLTVSLKLHPDRYGVEGITPKVSLSKAHDYAGHDKESSRTYSLSLVAKQQNYFGFDYTISSKTFQDHRFDNMWTIQGSWFNCMLAGFLPTLGCKYGREVDYSGFPPTLGYLMAPFLQFNIKPFAKLTFRLSYVRYALWKDQFKDRTYDSETFSCGMSYSFSQYLTARTVVQGSSDPTRADVSPLLSFEPTAFSVFYLGSNHSFEKTTSASRVRETERRIFLKLQYSFEL